MAITFYPIIAALFSMCFVWFLGTQVKRTVPFSFEGSAIHYARVQWKSSIVAAIVVVICFFFLGWHASIGFVIGAVAVFLLDFLANHLMRKTGGTVVEISKRGLEKAFDMLFKNGLSIALFSIAFAVLAISGSYAVSPNIAVCLGICAAAALLALFLAITKSQTFKAVFIFQTVAVTLTSAMLLGSLLYPSSPQFVLLPLALSAVLLLMMIVASLFAVIGKTQSVANAFYKFIAADFILAAAASYLVIASLMQNTAVSVWYLFFCALIGSVVAGIISLASKYSTNKLQLIALPIAVIAIGAVGAYFLASFYGVAILALTVLSAAAATTGMGFFAATVASLEAKLAPEAVDQKKTANALELGTKKTSGAIVLYEIIIAGFAGVAALLAFFSEINGQSSVNFMTQYPYLIGGFVIGVLLPYLFTRFSGNSSHPKHISLAIILPIALAIAFGYLFGPVAMLALLAGSIITGVLLASTTSVSPAMNSLIQTLPIAALMIISFLI